MLEPSVAVLIFWACVRGRGRGGGEGVVVQYMGVMSWLVSPGTRTRRVVCRGQLCGAGQRGRGAGKQRRGRS